MLQIELKNKIMRLKMQSEPYCDNLDFYTIE